MCNARQSTVLIQGNKIEILINVLFVHFSLKTCLNPRTVFKHAGHECLYNITNVKIYKQTEHLLKHIQHHIVYMDYARNICKLKQ